ncbi:MAG: haloacid dehalogenase-like hydrolase [Actinomycetota bacterium]|nr:haloacid dehalogenase-like hydrolase [Actinomycetota bacterium]
MNAAPADAGDVVVFDLDGTLVGGSSFGQFVRRLIYRSPWRLLLVALGSPMVLAMLLPRRTRIGLGSALVWLATVGRTESELQRRARTFASWHAGPDSGNRIEIALARLAAHQQSGAQVVVATAAVEPVASEIVRALGIVGATVVASRLHPLRGGWVSERDRRGTAKVTRLLAAGYTLPVDYAYADSSHDVALLRAARHPIAVQPGRTSWRILRAAVPDCEILTAAGLR